MPASAARPGVCVGAPLSPQTPPLAPQVRLAAAAFDAVAQLSCLASGYSDLELEMALLELQVGLL